MENLLALFDKDGGYLNYDFRGGPAWRTDADTTLTFTVSTSTNVGADTFFGQISGTDPAKVAFVRPVIIARAN